MVEKVERRNGREAKGLGRRRFLRYAVGFSFLSTLVGVLTPIIGYLWPPKRAATATGGRVLVGTRDEIPLGTGKLVALGDQPVITVNTEQGFLALSAVCTHLACIVHKTADEPYIPAPATMGASPSRIPRGTNSRAASHLDPRRLLSHPMMWLWRGIRSM